MVAARSNLVPGRFAEQVVVVAGAATGIGRSTALRFLSEGARVVFGDVNEAAVYETIASLEPSQAARAVFMQLDVAEEADHIRLRRMLQKDFGRLDVLVNNAAISGSADKVIHCRVQDWDRTVAVNLRGVFLGIKHAALMMTRQPEGGAIINISSVAAVCGSGGGLAYSAAKAGVINLTQTTAVELGPSKVRVNCICPCWILTPMVMVGDPGEIRRLAGESQPLPYPGEPEDVAGVAAFLASNDARFMTGATMMVDGGAMAEGPGFHTGLSELGRYVDAQMGVDRRRHFDVPAEKRTGFSTNPSRDTLADDHLTTVAHQRGSSAPILPQEEPVSRREERTTPLQNFVNRLNEDADLNGTGNGSRNGD
jgi:NAD(P)-dependent dehydrogenase (short-subunit alcohol dehydrogenase family)